MEYTKGKINLFKSTLPLAKLLKIFSINDQFNKPFRGKKCLKSILEPFSIFMHLTTIYNFSILSRYWIYCDGNKSTYGSLINCVLSLIIWHIVRARGHDFHNIIKYIKVRIPLNNFSSRYYITFTIMALSVCSLIPLILALISVISNEGPSCGSFWLYGYIPIKPNILVEILSFLCVLIYISQQILFPSVFLILFFTLNIKLVTKVERMKKSLNKNIFFINALSKQSRIHMNYIYKVRKYDELFSFPIFFTLCLVTVMGFTAIALIMQKIDEIKLFRLCEGFLYLYFSLVGILSITCSASMISSQFQIIKDFYHKEYELSNVELIENERIPSLILKKEQKILKLISERKIPHLTAWNFVRLDKSVVFSVFGTMITYGFLLVQLSKNE